MLYGILSHLFVMRSVRKQLAGTTATAAAELCWKAAHTSGLTAKLTSAADNFDQPWLISALVQSMLKLQFPAQS